MSMQSRYRFSAAWLPSGWRRNVVVSVDPEGDIVDVAHDDVVTTARLIQGAAIPGMPNVHSHAFQRAMAGLAEQRSSGDKGDSFWTWRETMYQLASRMTPEGLNAIAAQLYVDMLKAGYTSVCEFHYLHNQPDGRPYEDRTIMSQAIVDAAATSGIGSSQCVRGLSSSTSSTVPAGPSSIGRARRDLADSASRHTFVAIRYSHVLTDERPSKRPEFRHARTIVSWTASSASNAEPSMR